MKGSTTPLTRLHIRQCAVNPSNGQTLRQGSFFIRHNLRGWTAFG